MIRQCFAANTGIRFHTELLRHVGLDPASLYPLVQERPPPIPASRERLEELLARDNDIRQAKEEVRKKMFEAMVARMKDKKNAQDVPPTPKSTTPLVAPPLHDRDATLTNDSDDAPAYAGPAPLMASTKLPSGPHWEPLGPARLQYWCCSTQPRGDAASSG